MTRLNLSLSPDLQEFVEEQIARGGFSTAGDYISDLLNRARVEQAEQDRIEALLLQSLQTPARPMGPEEWDAIRREGRARLAQRDEP